MRRPRFAILKVTAFVAVALGILLVGELTQALAESWLTTQENAMVKEVNNHRGRIGARILSENAGLKMIARRQAQRMVMAGKIYHNPNLQDEADQAIPDWLLLGENVGVGPDEPSVEQAFLNSPAHRSNIEERDYNVIGLGAMAGDDGEMYFTQNYAQLQHVSSKPKRKPVAPAKKPSVKPPVVKAPVVRPKRAPALLRVKAEKVRALPAQAPPAQGVTRSPPEPDVVTAASSSALPQGRSVNLFNGLLAMIGEAISKIVHALSKLAFWR